MFIRFKNGQSKDLISIDKITCIKNVGIPYTLGKCNHYINFVNGERMEIDDIDYKNLIDFLEKNFIIEV
jgi:hypothetical protein